MSVFLVVNADDLGLHPRIDEGILHAHAEGILTSATVLVTGRSAPQAVQAARSQGLGLGVHLALVGGLPPALPPEQVPTLAPRGRLRESWWELARAFLFGKVRLGEIRAELDAQLDRARALGFTPDHLDSHQHLHLLPGLSSVFDALAARERLPLRWPREPVTVPVWEAPGATAKTALLVGLGRLPIPSRRAQRVQGHGLFEAGRLDEAHLVRILERLEPGEHELGCHPGFHPGSVPEDPNWRYGWETELSALTSPTVRALVKQQAITLCRFSELPSVPRRARAAS